MPGLARKISPRWLKSRALPWLVLAVGLAISVVSWAFVRSDQRRQDEARFERLQERVLAAVNLRFQAAAQALYGGRALVESQRELPAAQWADFVRSVGRFFDRGVVGLGCVERVERGQLNALETRVRAAGRPEFKVDRRVTRRLLIS